MSSGTPFSPQSGKFGSSPQVADSTALAAELPQRAKRREIERGVGTLLAKGWDMPRVVAGLGLWAGDRELRNADVLDEIASRLVRTQLASPARLVLHQPLDLLRQSFALGEEVRRERENAAQRTVVGQ